jgi:hypothetical protein
VQQRFIPGRRDLGTYLPTYPTSFYLHSLPIYTAAALLRRFGFLEWLVCIVQRGESLLAAVDSGMGFGQPSFFYMVFALIPLHVLGMFLPPLT